jgi:hypothetical protein
MIIPSYSSAFISSKVICGSTLIDDSPITGLSESEAVIISK